MWVRVTTSEGDGRIRMIAMLPCAVREAAGAFRAGYQCDGETWLSSCDTAVTRAERFAQQNAIGYAVRGPKIGSSAGHIDHRHLWIDLSCLLRNIPAGELALQMNIG